MREIKFRAWNTIHQIMFDVISIDWEDHELILDNANQYMDEVPFNDVKLMQYTGLKDRNGVEIYEGDIVKSTWTGDETFEVKYGEYYPRKVRNNTGIGFYITESDAIDTPLGRDINGEIQWTVVGNKYENPELLNKG